MYVCSCCAVTDRRVKSEISKGARTIEEIADRCGAGSLCHGCWPTLAKLLAEAERSPGQGKGPSPGTSLLGT